MITETSFFGLPLRTAAQRRVLVVFYYSLLIALTCFGFVYNRPFLQALLTQTLIFAGVLGGIRAGGPVKAYSPPSFETGEDGASSIVLGLSAGVRHVLATRYWTPLDERETARRNWVHFQAYRLLIWIFTFAALASCVAWFWIPVLLVQEAPLLLWLLLITVFSLPQAVLLWTEPGALD